MTCEDRLETFDCDLVLFYVKTKVVKCRMQLNAAGDSMTIIDILVKDMICDHRLEISSVI